MPSRVACTPRACIRHDIEGKPRKPFRYRDLGSAAYISRGHALLQAGPIRLTGFVRLAGLGVGAHRVPDRRAEPRQHAGDVVGRHRPREPHRPDVPARQYDVGRAALHVVGVRPRRGSPGVCGPDLRRHAGHPVRRFVEGQVGSTPDSSPIRPSS